MSVAIMFGDFARRLRRAFMAPRAGLFALAAVVLLAQAPSVAVAQQGGAGKPESARLQAFPTPQAAFDAFVAALRGNDEAAKRRLFGADFRKVVPVDASDIAALRRQFLEMHAAANRVRTTDDREAVLEVGTAGWTFPVPVVRTPAGWRFDVTTGLQRVRERVIGRNELATIQTVLAVADAQFDYAQMDPMKSGVPQYARRILSTPGKKDGLYWQSAAGEPESPLGALIAAAQAGGASSETGYHGYHYRLLYAQGPAAPGGAYAYTVRGRMIGGFALIAWPVKYRETGIMSFMVNHDGVVYEKDLGADTAAAAAAIKSFNPDKSWSKADTTP